jgi:dTDP-4-amino-4,6-dideoxygalactose transaminase
MFTILLPDADRTEFLRRLRAAGVGASVHFDPPVHLQPCHRETPVAPGGLQQTEYVAERIVSLPMYPGMSEADTEYVVESVRRALSDCPSRAGS